MAKTTHKKATHKSGGPRPRITARKCQGIDDLARLERFHREVLEADTARWMAGKRRKNDLVSAMGYWIGYPMFLEFIGHDWRTDEARTAAYYALNAAHTAATRVLMEAAERYGLDPHPLYECARVVQEIYADAPERYYAGRHDTWPECMGDARYRLPVGQQDALRAGEAVLMRLAVKAGVAAREDAAALADKVKPTLPQQAQRSDELITAEVAASQYGITKKTIRHRVKKGDFRDFRPAGAASNAKLIVSRADIERFYTRLK